MQILDVAPNVGGGRVANPIATQACYLGLSWGPGSNGVSTVILSIAGANVDSSFSLSTQDANVSTSPYNGQNMGWHPDNTQVFLKATDAAYGLWKVTFPSSGIYTINLGLAGQQNITVVDAPAAPVVATLSLVRTSVAGNLSMRVFQVSFTGNYPSGGFPIYGSDLGLGTPFFAHIQDTTLYRFVYDPTAYALHVYDSVGEVAGGTALTFTTLGLFHGSSQ